MGIGGIETGVRDISRFLKKNNIRNYILCEESNQNLKDRDLDFIHLKNLKFKNFFDQTKIKRFLSEIIDSKNINLVHISSRAPAFFLINFLRKKNIKIVELNYSRTLYSFFRIIKIIKNNKNVVIFSIIRHLNILVLFAFPA